MTREQVDVLVWRCVHDLGIKFPKDRPPPNLGPIRDAIRAAYMTGINDAHANFLKSLKEESRVESNEAIKP